MPKPQFFQRGRWQNTNSDSNLPFDEFEGEETGYKDNKKPNLKKGSCYIGLFEGYGSSGDPVLHYKARQPKVILKKCRGERFEQWEKVIFELTGFNENGNVGFGKLIQRYSEV